MTTIACWFNKENNHSVWVCGDSKITRENETLLNSGTKIFSIPVMCYVPDNNGFFNKMIYRTNIGLAYSGSSLVGLNLNAALSTCLSHLNFVSGVPSFDDIVNLANKLIKLYVSQLSLAAGKDAACEIAIIGICLASNDFKISHLKPRLKKNGGFTYVKKTYSCSNTPDDFVLLLGCDKKRIKGEIKKDRLGKAVDISWWRSPRKIIDSNIESGQNYSIGGHTQLGICNVSGFDVYSLCRPLKRGSPKAYFNYLGFDVHASLGFVGGCVMGIPAMV